jgi:hypothetical protein
MGAMAAPKSVGVFVMEGKWEEFRPARRSATHLVDLLVDHRIVRAEFNDTLRQRHLRRSFERWRRKRAFPIGYLAAHGELGTVELQRFTRSARLADIGDWIGDDGAKGRVLILGTCLTLGAARQAQTLVDRTGLLGAFGYRRMIDSIHAAAWEVLLLNDLAGAYSAAKKPTKRAVERRIDRLVAAHGTLVQDLGFVRVWSTA